MAPLHLRSSRKTQRSGRGRNRAFTLIELVVVITIVAILGTLIAVRVGIFSYWKEESFLRRLSETITFLHYQATVDRLYYEIIFDRKEKSYSVVALKPIKQTTLATGGTVGRLTAELAQLVSPALGVSHDASPPPDFPSLADPIKFPDEMELVAIHVPNAAQQSDNQDTVSILFSPQGIVDGAILQFANKQGAPISMLINPLTGLSTLYRSEVDFDRLLEDIGANTNTTLE